MLRCGPRIAIVFVLREEALTFAIRSRALAPKWGDDLFARCQLQELFSPASAFSNWCDISYNTVVTRIFLQNVPLVQPLFIPHDIPPLPQTLLVRLVIANLNLVPRRPRPCRVRTIPIAVPVESLEVLVSPCIVHRIVPIRSLFHQGPREGQILDPGVLSQYTHLVFMRGFYQGVEEAQAER